jgi:pantothenate kinase
MAGRFMDERVTQPPAILSPYHRFTRSEWASLRADTPLTLTVEDLNRLRSLSEPLSLEEVIEIYLPLSRLLALYVAATQGLYKATQRFLGSAGGKVPYIIGVAGSVDARTRHAGAASTLAEHAKGSARYDRRLSLSERHPRGGRPDGQEGLSRKL